MNGRVDSCGGGDGEENHRNGPLAVKFTMEAIERGVEMAQEEGLFLEATLFGVACATEDMREGTKAFLEKRAHSSKGSKGSRRNRG